MSVLLTVSQPRVEFGHRPFTHELPPRTSSLPRSRADSPKPVKAEPPSVTSLRANASTTTVVDRSSPPVTMATSHRGLPPPSAMGLPEPSRPPPQLGAPLGAMPNPPHQWQGQEESMRQWLVAKTEEDKRKQEEEKTRQEGLRLEQRLIEQSMLRESLQGGIPPHMVPMIYAGIGGANLANVSLDWLQQYAAQLQASHQHQQQQQQHQPHQVLPAAQSPDLRRETRMIGQAPYAVVSQPAQPPVLPSQVGIGAPQPSQGATLQTTFPAYQPSPGSPRRAPTSAPRATLPRLNTNELYMQPAVAGGPSSGHPLQQSQSQDNSSPSIYFHHWVPPEQKTQPPQTPASKEPGSAHPASHLSENEFKDSPRKRKAQGQHQANPPPSAGPQHTSPSFSTISSSSGRKANSHARSRSSTSNRGPDSRPESRRQATPPRLAQVDQTKAGAAAEEDQRASRMPPGQREELRRSRPPSSEAPRANVRDDIPQQQQQQQAGEER